MHTQTFLGNLLVDNTHFGSKAASKVLNVFFYLTLDKNLNKYVLINFYLPCKIIINSNLNCVIVKQVKEEPLKNLG